MKIRLTIIFLLMILSRSLLAVEEFSKVKIEYKTIHKANHYKKKYYNRNLKFQVNSEATETHGFFFLGNESQSESEKSSNSSTSIDSDSVSSTNSEKERSLESSEDNSSSSSSKPRHYHKKHPVNVHERSEVSYPFYESDSDNSDLFHRHNPKHKKRNLETLSISGEELYSNETSNKSRDSDSINSKH